LNNPTSTFLRVPETRLVYKLFNTHYTHRSARSFINPSHNFPYCSIRCKRFFSTPVHARRPTYIDTAILLQPLSPLSTTSTSPLPGTTTLFITTLSYLSIFPPIALADEITSSYNPGDGEGVLKTAAGVGYLLLVAIYFLRLFSKRAKQAKTERIASVISASASETVAPLKAIKVKRTDGTEEEEEDDDDDDDKEEDIQSSNDTDAIVTPVNTLIGAAQAAFICTLLFQGCKVVDAFFDGQTLPTQYTAHNIAVLVQTVVRGLAYLLTFIFGANALGLSALTLQLIMFPDSLEEEGRVVSKDEPLPRVALTDDIFAIRKAFELADRQGKAKAASIIQQQSNNSDSSDGRK